MFELYAKTKLDLAAEGSRHIKCGANEDTHLLDILRPLQKDIDHGVLTAIISQLIVSDQMKKPES